MHHSIDHDIRVDIFSAIADRQVSACILADADGVIAEIDEAIAMAAHLNLIVEQTLMTGARVRCGDQIMKLRGSPMQVAMGEDRLIGCLAKPSGIATMARRFVDRAGGDLTIVSGAWKKMPIALKLPIRRAAAAGGAEVRISRAPFIYLDKNYVRMFGGIVKTLRGVPKLDGFRRVIQICGRYGPIGEEAVQAAECGADVVFIDTGNVDDIVRVTESLVEASLRQRLDVAFGGGVTLDMIDDIKGMDVDLVDVGRPIIDAPLLDMRLVVANTFG
jgi:nicotinate-nucleotide pyrophosphorylase (carboxylating)